MTSPVELRGFGSSELAPRDRKSTHASYENVPCHQPFRAAIALALIVHGLGARVG